jgi:hypothetical protein
MIMATLYPRPVLALGRNEGFLKAASCARNAKLKRGKWLKMLKLSRAFW